MSKKDPIVFLKHVLECIEIIEGYIKDTSEKDFLKDIEKQDAINRRLEIIGEAVKNLPEDFKKQHSDVKWNKAMGTRNILIHHYFGINLEIVWDTVTESLPEFKEQIKNLIDEAKNQPQK